MKDTSRGCILQCGGRQIIMMPQSLALLITSKFCTSWMSIENEQNWIRFENIREGHKMVKPLPENVKLHPSTWVAHTNWTGRWPIHQFSLHTLAWKDKQWWQKWPSHIRAHNYMHTTTVTNWPRSAEVKHPTRRRPIIAKISEPVPCTVVIPVSSTLYMFCGWKWYLSKRSSYTS